ncbi:hypothetical protein BCR44DRAFT_1463329 [Catenaria anguillulae PL171]|uniref:Uncharacterized protein n=1 Tax=Catenaria anguillulae PL171 TaxID=765915 RepID=A0A1Y2HC32_9FUNG|nr:hypothetical protein BCR44DRAFT_1463329 [Catenaria anguillulae PL171]
MASSNIKTFDRPGTINPSANTTLALCSGDSFVTRLDLEIAHRASSDSITKKGVHMVAADVVGIFVTCSDKSPKQGIAAPPFFGIHRPQTLFQGSDSPNGIRDVLVTGASSVKSIGYADALVGVVSPTGGIWRQVDSEYDSCVLKGIQAEHDTLITETINNGCVQSSLRHHVCTAILKH